MLSFGLNDEYSLFIKLKSLNLKGSLKQPYTVQTAIEIRIVANDTYTLNKHGLSDGTYELFRNNPSIKESSLIFFSVRLS